MPSPRLTGAGLLFILLASLSCLFGVSPRVLHAEQAVAHHVGSGGRQALGHAHDHAAPVLLQREAPQDQGLLQGLGLLATLLSLSFCTALGMLLRRNGSFGRASPVSAVKRIPVLAAALPQRPSPPALQVFRL
ncbi:hypothetical protein [Rubrobacter naiadicus]|uniref:hypothetical protein n=1 Tax=Rubrobacter naiadicus TaxID=1392641 RepID=UPI002362DD42|nr:hypothetical protein [Rubrobacter naiadicus]